MSEPNALASLDLFVANYVDWSLDTNVVGRTKNGQKHAGVT
jgi:hypothetical protein